MFTHLSNLRITDILQMNRSSLIGTLMEFNQHSALRFRRADLMSLSNSSLRQTLMEVRRHYQARGY